MGRGRQSHSKEQWLLAIGFRGGWVEQNMCFCALGLCSALSQHVTCAWAPRVWVSPFLLG